VDQHRGAGFGRQDAQAIQEPLNAVVGQGPGEQDRRQTVDAVREQVERVVGALHADDRGVVSHGQRGLELVPGRRDGVDDHEDGQLGAAVRFHSVHVHPPEF
jgi:hypothetical protein